MKHDKQCEQEWHGVPVGTCRCEVRALQARLAEESKQWLDSCMKRDQRVAELKALVAEWRPVVRAASAVPPWLKTFGMTMMPAEKPWTDFMAAVAALSPAAREAEK